MRSTLPAALLPYTRPCRFTRSSAALHARRALPEPQALYPCETHYSQLCCFTRPKGLTRAAGSLPVRSTLSAALLPFLTTPPGVLNYSKLLSTARKRSLTSSSSPTTLPSSGTSRTSQQGQARRSGKFSVPQWFLCISYVRSSHPLRVSSIPSAWPTKT